MSMPVSRRQILAVKFVVLALMLAGLHLVAWLWGVRRESLSEVWLAARNMPVRTEFDIRLAQMLPLLSGLCLAPWFTMIARSPLAGAVFAVAVLSTMWVASELLAIARFFLPAHASSMATASAMVGWRGVLAVCAIGAIGSWVTFSRLQPGAGPLGISLPRRWSRDARDVRRADRTSVRLPAPQRRHWMRSLVLKELHLHSILLAITLLYVAAWYVMAVSRPYVPVPLQLPLSTFTVVYGGTVALLVGSFASAEERQIGVAQWQQLLPVAMWRQWTVKTAVVLILAFGLGLGLPWLLESVTPGLGTDDTMDVEVIPVVGAMAIVSLYVSSLSPSGLRALVASVGVSFAGGIALFLLDSLGRTVTEVTYPLLRTAPWRRLISMDTAQGIAIGVALVAAVIVVGLLLRYAMVNHRNAERSARAIRRQVGWVAAVILLSTVTLGVLEATARRPWAFDGTDGVQVTGHAEFESVPTRLSDSQLSRIGLYLRAETRRGTNGAFEPDGGFTTPYISPGRYTIRISGPAGWTVKSVTYQGRDVSETPIDVRSDLHGVVVNFTDRPGAIEGAVQTAAGKLATDADVLLFSVDASHWFDYGDSSRRVRVTAAPDGRYSVPMPRAGEYWLIAVSHDRIVFKRDPKQGRFHREGYVYAINGRLTFFANDEELSTLFNKLIPFADRIQAREGETITLALTVKQVPAATGGSR